MSERVKEILSWYGSDNPGTLTNLARLLNSGTLAGTGRLVILPVDQGVEHGPARSFAVNPAAYDPRYHFELAVEAGCNGYAAPLGFIEAGAREFAGQVPLILKVNNHDVLLEEKDPVQAVTGSVRDALRLGCVGIGYTIYPGSTQAGRMYEQIRVLAEEAKRVGLAVVVWSYPRGSDLSKEGETGIDVVAYAAQIAAQLGAHIVKVKLPSAHVEQAEARKVYEKYAIPVGTLAERVRHGDNGLLFSTAEQLADIVFDLFENFPADQKRLERLRAGARKSSRPTSFRLTTSGFMPCRRMPLSCSLPNTSGLPCSR